MKWNKVEEGLPELNKQILVYGGTKNHPCQYKEMLQSYFYKMSNCDIIKCGKDDMYWGATHWAELPSIPND